MVAVLRFNSRIGQVVFAYNFFKTLIRKKQTNKEQQYEENQRERLLREQNSYIDKDGKIMDITASLQDKEEGVGKKDR
jgi:hypothetical protein